jgi:hypothetical protein
MKFSLSRVRVAIPEPCQELPASDSLTTPRFQVTTSLKRSDGDKTIAISLPTTWRCVRNRAGTITEMRTITPTLPAQRPGLRVSIHGPRSVIPGATISYTIQVRNIRRGPHNRTISSLWNLITRVNLTPARTRQPTTRVHFATTTVVRRLRELRRGQSKTLRIPIHIPAALSKTHLRRVCVTAGTTADAARSALAQGLPHARPATNRTRLTTKIIRRSRHCRFHENPAPARGWSAPPRVSPRNARSRRHPATFRCRRSRSGSGPALRPR